METNVCHFPIFICFAGEIINHLLICSRGTAVQQQQHTAIISRNIKHSCCFDNNDLGHKIEKLNYIILLHYLFIFIFSSFIFIFIIMKIVKSYWVFLLLLQKTEQILPYQKCENNNRKISFSIKHIHIYRNNNNISIDFYVEWTYTHTEQQIVTLQRPYIFIQHTFKQ